MYQISCETVWWWWEMQSWNSHAKLHLCKISLCFLTKCDNNCGFIWQVLKWQESCITAPACSQPHPHTLLNSGSRNHSLLTVNISWMFFWALVLAWQAFFWWALSLPITVSWGHLTADYGLKVPFKSARQPFSQTFSQLFIQPAATGKFPAVKTGRKKESQLAEEANVASCGLRQTHQATGHDREDSIFSCCHTAGVYVYI